MRIILIGFGSVGIPFMRNLQQSEGELLRRYGLRPRVVAVVDRGGAAVDSQGLDFTKLVGAKEHAGSVARVEGVGRLGMTAVEAIDGVDADVVVEVSPTNLVTGDPGLTHIETALKQKRHVITANKGPLAIAFPALMELAAYNKVHFRFSGTVGGGTPILDVGKKCLLGDRVTAVRGIVNGTTNYILTRMAEANVHMQTALAEAQAAGYAEADPTNDVDGLDSGCKLVILANWIMNRPITLKDVAITGIQQIDVTDVAQASSQGCVIKLIAAITEDEVSVKPQAIPRTNPLNVDGVLNAVTYSTHYAGEITIVGHGAGGVETSSAILRDLIDIRRNLAL